MARRRRGGGLKVDINRVVMKNVLVFLEFNIYFFFYLLFYYLLLLTEVINHAIHGNFKKIYVNELLTYFCEFFWLNFPPNLFNFPYFC